MDKKTPILCPSCESSLSVVKLRCDNCETEVSGHFSLPLLSRLTQEEQFFVLEFFKESGKLNVMAKKLEISYPTLRNKLDDLIEKVKSYEASDESKT